MGWEQRPHSAGSSPDSFCLHLGPSERLTCILVALQRVVLTPAAPTRQAAGGCREVRAGAWLRSAAYSYGVKGLGPWQQLLCAALSGRLATS